MLHVLFLANPCCSSEPRLPNYKVKNQYQKQCEMIGCTDIENHQNDGDHLWEAYRNSSPHCFWWLKDCLSSEISRMLECVYAISQAEVSSTIYNIDRDRRYQGAQEF